MPTVLSDVLQQLEKDPALLRENWCVPRETGRLLYLLALTTRAKRICEIGTSIGYSTLWLAQAVQQTQGLIDTLDYFPERQRLAENHITQAGLASFVRFHTGQAIERLRMFQQEKSVFDFVFIDAAKKEYIDYIQLLEPILVSGALVVADNTQSHRKEMLDFLAYMDASPDFDVAELETSNGQLIARKR